MLVTVCAAIKPSHNSSECDEYKLCLPFIDGLVSLLPRPHSLPNLPPSIEAVHEPRLPSIICIIDTPYVALGSNNSFVGPMSRIELSNYNLTLMLVRGDARIE
jgi:hypothetical protein